MSQESSNLVPFRQRAEMAEQQQITPAMRATAALQAARLMERNSPRPSAPGAVVDHSVEMMADCLETLNEILNQARAAGYRVILNPPAVHVESSTIVNGELADITFGYALTYRLEPMGVPVVEERKPNEYYQVGTPPALARPVRLDYFEAAGLLVGLTPDEREHLYVTFDDYEHGCPYCGNRT